MHRHAGLLAMCLSISLVNSPDCARLLRLRHAMCELNTTWAVCWHIECPMAATSICVD